MFRKITDILKEVFWLKPARKKTAKVSRVKKASKKAKVKPKAVRSPAKTKPKAAKPAVRLSLDSNLMQVGQITHYFDRIKVCVVKITQGTILIGDKLTMAGPKTKFVQKVWSMQIESQDVKVAKKGQLVGLKVDKVVAVGDKVYK